MSFSISQLLKNTRVQLGLTQFQLAQQSHVSLPTIQNIEAGKGNPSFETLQALLGALNFELKVEQKAVDWDAFASLGAPITVSESFSPTAHEVARRRSPSELAQQIRAAAYELSALRGDEVRDRERKIEALQALILAVRSHYPSFYAKELKSSPCVGQFLMKAVSGRVIKLKRNALSRISAYL